MASPSPLDSECREWLSKARDDLIVGQAVLHYEPHAYAGVPFHAQQAAEKALKGFLVLNGIEFRKTHNLATLGQACQSIDETMKPIVDEAAALTDFAWLYRYPSGEPDPSEQEARDALDLAQRVYDAVLARVPAAARP